MFDFNAFKDAVGRLKLFNEENIFRFTTNDLDKPPALAFCSKSVIFDFAREISQHLSEYHVWARKPSPEKNRLVERIAEEKGVKATTIKSRMKVSGLLVSEILRWLGQELWAIVILFLLYIRK